MAEWKQVPGLPDYVACSDGRIARVVGHTSGNGYKQVETSAPLVSGGKEFGTRVSWNHHNRVFSHHLVAVTFIGPPPKGKTQINHKNGNRSDNSVVNLEWSNQSHNIQHAWDTGRIPRKRMLRIPVLLKKKILSLRALGLSYPKIAAKVGVSINTVGYQVRLELSEAK